MGIPKFASGKDITNSSPVNVFWDMENMEIPLGCDALKFCDNLIREFEKRGQVQKITIFTDLKKISDFEKEILLGSGFELIGSASRREMCERMIVEDILFCLLDLKHTLMTPCIILITASGAFSHFLTKLANRDCIIHVITNLTSSGRICDYAHNYWEQLASSSDLHSSHFLSNSQHVNSFLLPSDLIIGDDVTSSDLFSDSLSDCDFDFDIIKLPYRQSYQESSLLGVDLCDRLLSIEDDDCSTENVASQDMKKESLNCQNGKAQGCMNSEPEPNKSSKSRTFAEIVSQTSADTRPSTLTVTSFQNNASNTTNPTSVNNSEELSTARILHRYIRENGLKGNTIRVDQCLGAFYTKFPNAKAVIHNAGGIVAFCANSSSILRTMQQPDNKCILVRAIGDIPTSSFRNSESVISATASPVTSAASSPSVSLLGVSSVTSSPSSHSTGC